MSRLSTCAMSTFRSALNVRSTTLPDSTLFSLVRTTAPPLPGLWCWNHTTDHSCPSRLSTMPFLRSFVVATRGYPSKVVSGTPDCSGPARRNRFVGPRAPYDAELTNDSHGQEARVTGLIIMAALLIIGALLRTAKERSARSTQPAP